MFVVSHYLPSLYEQVLNSPIAFLWALWASTFPNDIQIIAIVCA